MGFIKGEIKDSISSLMENSSRVNDIHENIEEDNLFIENIIKKLDGKFNNSNEIIIQENKEYNDQKIIIEDEISEVYKKISKIIKTFKPSGNFNNFLSDMKNSKTKTLSTVNKVRN